jgi:hypothetical protein
MQRSSLNKTRCWSHLQRRSCSKINWMKNTSNTSCIWEQNTNFMLNTQPYSSLQCWYACIAEFTIQIYNSTLFSTEITVPPENAARLSKCEATLHGAPSVLGRSKFLGQPTIPKQFIQSEGSLPRSHDPPLIRILSHVIPLCFPIPFL